MRLYRAHLTIQITNTEGQYDYQQDLPVYYVAARDPRDGQREAIRVACAIASPRDLYRLRGVLVEIDPAHALAEPIGTVREWDDIGD